MKRWWSWSAVPATLLLGVTAQALELTSLRDTGPAARRFSVVVLGDGYRAQDQAQLAADAEALVSHVFSTAPLQSYAQFFNVQLVHVISSENGADNGDFGTVRDTALGAAFDCGAPDLLCLNDGAALTVALEHVPELDLVLALVNDTRVGGSGGNILVSSAAPAAFEIVAHELGHTFGGLADESESPSPSYPPCSPVSDCPEANVTLRTDRQQVKWSAWLDVNTPLPTPEDGAYAGVVGLFEGARYLDSGVYRPAQTCKMRSLGQPYCPVCSEQLVRRIWSGSKIRMIESFSPEANLTLTGCAPVELQITSPVITPTTYRHTWTVDGVQQADGASSFLLDPATLAPGAHEVRVVVRDDTALVRTAPDGLLDEEHVWTLSMAANDCGGSSDAGPEPDAGQDGGSAGTPSAGTGGASSGGGAGASGGAASTSGGAASTSGGAAGAEQTAGNGGNAGAESGLGGASSGAAGGAPDGPGSGTPAAQSSQGDGCGCAIVTERQDRFSAVLGLALALAWARRRWASPAR